MSQTKLLKDDILKILSKSVSGGTAASDADKAKTPIVYESSETPEVFFGGADDPTCKKDGQKVVKFCAKKKEKKPAKAKKPAKPKSTKAPSAWILHVKKYAADNNVSYKQAMKDSKSSYKSGTKPTAPAKPAPAKPAAKPKKKIKLVKPAPQPSAPKEPRKKIKITSFEKELPKESKIVPSKPADIKLGELVYGIMDLLEPKKLGASIWKIVKISPKSVTLLQTRYDSLGSKRAAGGDVQTKRIKSADYKYLIKPRLSADKLKEINESTGASGDTPKKAAPKKAAPKVSEEQEFFNNMEFEMGKNRTKIGNYVWGIKRNPKSITFIFQDQYGTNGMSPPKKNKYTIPYSRIRYKLDTGYGKNSKVYKILNDIEGGALKPLHKPLHKHPDGHVMTGAKHTKKSKVVGKLVGGAKKTNSWIEFVKAYAKKHGVKYNVAIKEAKASYKKSPVGGAEEEPKKEEPKTEEPAAAEISPKMEKQKNIVLADVLENLDIFGKEFQNTTNSGQSLSQKQTNYDQIMERAGRYHAKIDKSGMSENDITRIDSSFEYLQETYTIGYRSLVGGMPETKTDFGEYDEDKDMGDTIYNSLKVPKVALDTYTTDIKKFVHNEDDSSVQKDFIKFVGRDEPTTRPLMRNYPDYIIEQTEIDAPVYGQVAEYTIPHPIPYFGSETYSGGASYPSNALESQESIKTPLYRKNMLDPKKESTVFENSKEPIIGGSAKLKKKLKEDVKKLFMRDMKKKFTKKSAKQIEAVYKKHKAEIQSFITDVIVDEIRGGSYHGGAECGADQYKSGDKCYDKQQRQTGKFDKDKFLEEQKLESKKNIADAPIVAPKPIERKMVKDTVDDANKTITLIPQVSDADKSDGFIDDFSKAVTPPDRGPIFNTTGDDISDPKAWIDTIANIAVGTAKGLETIWDALDPGSWF